MFAVDSNVMIAAVCSWHVAHAAAAAAITLRLRRGEALAVPAHALTEAYSVLTRLLAPSRLSPADAWALLRANFVEGAEVVALPSVAHTRVLAALAKDGVAGGRTYDALVAACARQAKAATLLTLNPRDFEPASADLRIVDPSTER